MEKYCFFSGTFTLASLFAAAASLPTPSQNSLSPPDGRISMKYNGTAACSSERYKMCYSRKNVDVGQSDHEDGIPLFSDQALEQLCLWVC